MPRPTALIVPVPEGGAYYDGEPGVPAHITVLVPFVDGASVDEEAVADLLSPFRVFDFRLVRVERFPNGLTFVRPEPADPFRELTLAVWRRWPDHPPYEGAHDTIVPHLTVTRTDVPVPIDCRAAEVRLIERGRDGIWRSRRTFPLAQGVA